MLGVERDPSLAFIHRARAAMQGSAPVGERPLEARLRTLQATAGNAAVGRFLQREVAGGAGTADAPAAPATHSKLTYDSRGDEVRELQKRLNQANAAEPALVVDGIYGRKTQAAVRVFQRANPPLEIDGDAGPETWAAIDRADASGGSNTGADSALDTTAGARDPYDVGKEHFAAGRYGEAYDEFTKAYEQSGDPAFLWNRAQALRLLGGRIDEAIALFEQFAKLDVGDDAKTKARARIAELSGPGRSTDEAANTKAVEALHGAGAKLYAAEEYGKAYDEFTKAYRITNDPAMLWNRAQALHFLGGRTSEAIALFEQFIAANVSEDNKVAAKREIADMKGPGETADKEANKSAADVLYAKGRALYVAAKYVLAYDEFTKAWEITHDPALLFNRAQSRRLEGGRRAEAITLFEQFLASNISEDARKAAKVLLDELRGQVMKAQDTTAKP